MVCPQSPVTHQTAVEPALVPSPYKSLQSGPLSCSGDGHIRERLEGRLIEQGVAAQEIGRHGHAVVAPEQPLPLPHLHREQGLTQLQSPAGSL
jgi:hypothetical protein